MTSPCPKESAKFLDNTRVVKMVLETAQMLSTALAYHFIDIGYKTTHPNHPCNIWVRKSRENFLWTVEHGKALSEEYTKRYGKVHKSLEVILKAELYASHIPSKGLTEPANCAANEKLGISFKHLDNVYEAYKQYLYARFLNDKKPSRSNI